MEDGGAVQDAGQRPTLVHLCMKQAARRLLDLAGELHHLPLELAEILLTDYLGRGDNPRLIELEIISEAFWNPKRICLMGAEGLNSVGLHHLSYSSALVKLDLSGCSWLDSLDFLPELVQLRCLCLRDCWRLAGEALFCIQRLPRLQCLDVENVFSITDNLAARFIQGMSSLQALNVGGTGVANGFVEALTYGCRLQTWDASRGTHGLSLAAQGVAQGHDTSSRNLGIDAHGHLLKHWPPLQIKYLRLQRTMVTQAATSQLLALKDIMLLDVRTLNVTRRSLAPIQAKYGLVTLPNDSRLMARSNLLLVAALGTACGCLAVSDTDVVMQQGNTQKGDWAAQFEHRGFVQLLQEASRVRSRGLH